MQVVRAAVDAFVAGDVDEVARLYKRDARIAEVPDGWPEPAPIEGRDSVIGVTPRVPDRSCREFLE